MERKHTIGHWRVVIHNTTGERLVMPLSGTLCVATVNDYGGMPAEANANLIAAAPELLDAVSWFIDQLQGDSGTGDSYWSEFSEYRAALAAYSKATGGAPNGGAS